MNINGANYSQSFGQTDNKNISNGHPICDSHGKVLYYKSEDNSDIAKLCDSYINNENTKDIKSPVMILTSVALAVLGTYAAGRKAASTLTALPVLKNAPEFVEKSLKSGSKKVQGYAQTLINDASEGKMNKLKNYTGKTIQVAEKAVRNIYKKIAYKSIPDNVVNPERARRALTNAAGCAAAVSIAPQIIGNDNDEDGIKDIAQKSQNAYTGRSNDLIDATNKLTVIGELVEALS